jgi:hypothetical protein
MTRILAALSLLLLLAFLATRRREEIVDWDEYVRRAHWSPDDDGWGIVV